MKNKQQLITEFLAQPIQIGDPIDVQGLGSKDKSFWGRAYVKSIEGEYLTYQKYLGTNSSEESIKISEIRRSMSHIGPNPFRPEVRIDSFKTTIENLFYHVGFNLKTKTYKYEIVNGQQVPEACLSPMVVDAAGQEVEYQRGLVWNLEQKQLLIDSIYNHIDIGKFVLRNRSWEWIEKRVKANKLQYTAFKDVVDGKQRITALVEFVSNSFQDSNGLLFEDLSTEAQRHFMSYNNLQLNQMPETAEDEDVLNYFLALNFAGVPMSKAHIEYVKSINVK